MKISRNFVVVDSSSVDVDYYDYDRYKEHHVHQGIVADVSPLQYEPLAPDPAPAPGGAATTKVVPVL